MEKVSLNALAARDIISLGIKTKGKINKDFEIYKSQKEEKVISLGSEGNVVRSLQRLLNSMEGINIQEDGRFGVETYKAVIKFQDEKGLIRDGFVNRKTAVAIIDSVRKKNNVLKVQQRLRELGYMDKKYETGLMDSVTRVSIKLFEARKWLESNGMIDTARTRPRYINATNGSKFQLEERSLNTEYLVVVKKIRKKSLLFYSVPSNEEELSEGSVRLSLEDAKYIHYNIPARTKIKILN